LVPKYKNKMRKLGLAPMPVVYSPGELEISGKHKSPTKGGAGPGGLKANKRGSLRPPPPMVDVPMVNFEASVASVSAAGGASSSSSAAAAASASASSGAAFSDGRWKITKAGIVSRPDGVSVCSLCSHGEEEEGQPSQTAQGSASTAAAATAPPAAALPVTIRHMNELTRIRVLGKGAAGVVEQVRHEPTGTALL
jgi:hypothetical protein